MANIKLKSLLKEDYRQSPIGRQTTATTGFTKAGLPVGWKSTGLHQWKHQRTKFRIWVQETSKGKYSVFAEKQGQSKEELAKNKKYPDVVDKALDFVRKYAKGVPKKVKEGKKESQC